MSGDNGQKYVSPKKIGSWGLYRSVATLEKNKPYMVNELIPTDHPEYGKGERTFLSKGEEKLEAHLPKKYLREVGEERINKFRSDILDGRHPFLIFRRQREDNSFAMEILDHSIHLHCSYLNWEDVPEPFVADTYNHMDVSEDTKKNVRKRIKLEVEDIPSSSNGDSTNGTIPSATPGTNAVPSAMPSCSIDQNAFGIEQTLGWSIGSLLSQIQDLKKRQKWRKKFQDLLAKLELDMADST